ncbi:MAG: hypothetical protein QOH91_3218, partial [Mycobacterium sp.]|nr:hypothetical protein [Mycobacterium sp.]
MTTQQQSSVADIWPLTSQPKVLVF